MSGVAKFNQSNFSTQDPATYKASIDGNFKVLSQIGNNFAPYQAGTPNMTVLVGPGSLMAGGALVSVAEQATATITAPSVNPRIDYVVLDVLTGAVSVVTGAEAGSPVPPAIPTNKIPVCTVALAVSQTSIVNANITDMRTALNLTVPATCATLSSNTALTLNDFIMNAVKVVTTSATLTLPAASSVPAGVGSVKVKSLTTGSLLIAPAGADTMDGVNAVFAVPSFCVVEIIPVGGAWALIRPDINIGDVKPSSGSVAPLGWLLMDASAVGRTAYAGLFGVTGTTFGAGDGFSTFNLPDGKGRTLVGAGSGTGLTSRAVGDKIGEEAHALIATENGIHGHTVNDPGHLHPNGMPPGTVITGPGGGGYNGGNTGTANTGITVNNSGSGNPHNNMQPSLVLNWIIKT